MALTDKLKAIADAIRAKTGKSDKLTLDAMAAEIAGIEGGSSAGNGNLHSMLDGTITSYADEGVKKLRSGAFRGLESLTSVNLPNLMEIGSYAFEGTGLINADFPSCEVIDGAAMASTLVSKLESVSLPKAVLKEDNGIVIAGETITSVNIPKITSIRATGFQNCQSLPKLYLPSVNRIMSFSWTGTFENCYKLTALILPKSDACVTLDDATRVFSNCPINNGGYKGADGYIYVPKALVEDYKVATNWVMFADRIRAIEDYPDIAGGA